MCGRYSLAKSKMELEERFQAEMLEDFKPRYNIAPSQLVPVITCDSPKGFSHFYWGITPAFAKNKPVANRLINARSETITEKVSFKNAFKKSRCLVPADGFFEWKKVGKKTKVPYRFVFLDESLFSFAGIWEEFETEKGEIAHTFTILTTRPNGLTAEIHDRMPVILKNENEEKWLNLNTSEEELLSMLSPYPDEQMTKYTVSPMVNQVTNDSPFVIRKTLPMDQFGNYTLFG
ncbi:SOS response-associated peptidase [Cyclobacterium marinum]|uniref:SOS response-associated peptidase n=1 Tax=Cyclobacterium marinum TaxID=104 RepID=UPI0011EFB2D2|nr:SOS response-associated peptidase [Cyclobacterium marinum]MBI0399139.1 SOS response-associated peptidase [Cyclobacterium marinum]